MCLVVQNENIIGFNYDFFYGHGLVVTNLKGVNKVSLTDEDKDGVKWKSKYGSITFNLFGIDLPQGGMNERGLVVICLGQEDGKMPSKNVSSGISELQWIQYQLDNCSDVEEVLNTLDKIIPEKSMMDLHYVVVDEAKNFAIIDYINGEKVITLNPETKLITNSSYGVSIKSVLEDVDNTTMSNYAKSSIKSYVKAYHNLNNGIENNKRDKENMLNVMEKSEYKRNMKAGWDYITKGTPPTFTYWSILFNIEKREISFFDIDNKKERSISMNSFKFNKEEGMKVVEIQTKLSGDIFSKFRPFIIEDNRKIINKSYKPVKEQITPEDKKRLIEYPNSFIFD